MIPPPRPRTLDKNRYCNVEQRGVSQLPEEAEVYGVSHGGVAGILWVEMVSAVVLRCEGEGMSRIASGLIEVDSTVKDAAVRIHVLTASRICSPFSVA